MKATLWVRVAVIIGAALVTEFLCRSGMVSRLVLIPPSEMVLSLVSILAAGTFNAAFASTAKNVFIAFCLSVGIGFVAGVIIHNLPRVRRALDPFFASYYAIPTFIFYPLFIALFGLNDWPLILIGCAFGVVGMVISTLTGLDRVPRGLRKLAKALNLSRVDEVRRIILPASAPFLFTGLKLSLAYSFLGIIGGEFILSGGGLGFAIANSYNTFENNTMYALILLVLFLAIVVNSFLYMWERRLMRRRAR